MKRDVWPLSKSDDHDSKDADLHHPTARPLNSSPDNSAPRLGVVNIHFPPGDFTWWRLLCNVLDVAALGADLADHINGDGDCRCPTAATSAYRILLTAGLERSPMEPQDFAFLALITSP